MVAAVKKRENFLFFLLKMEGELRGLRGNDEGSVPVPTTWSGLQVSRLNEKIKYFRFP